jgi:HSP20 family protein
MVSRSKENERKENGTQQAHENLNDGGGLATAEPRGMTRFHRYEPFSMFRNEFNRLVDHFFPSWPMSSEMSHFDGWRLDMQEDDKTVTVRAEAPGFEPSDFDIQVRGQQLIVKADRKSESEEKDNGFHEWHQEQFYRSVMLPEGTESDKVDAEYHNGVLTIKVPKGEQTQSHRIEVKS